MKKLFRLAGLGLLCLGLPLVGRSQTYQFLGSLATVNNTTSNGMAVAISGYTGIGSMSIQTGGMYATNQLTVNFQLSFDNTNFFTVQSFNAATNAAGTCVVYPSFTTPIYVRGQAVTTTNMQVGVNYTP